MPPEAASVALYAVPVVPIGIELVVMASGVVAVVVVVVVVVVGAGLIVNDKAAEVPPFLPGVYTATLPVPATATMVLVTENLNVVELTYVVAWETPFQSTVEPLVKLDPLTVTNIAVPAVVLVGEIAVITGRFFCAAA